MKIRTKLLILVTTPLLALLVLGGVEIVNSYQAMQESHLLLQTAEISTHISNLVHESQKERGRTAGFLGSQGKQFGSELATQRTQTDEKVNALTKSLENFPKENTSAHFQTLLDEAITAIKELSDSRRQIDTQSISVADAIGSYTHLNEKLLTVIETIADQCTTGHVAIEFTAHLFLQKVKENAGIERALLSNTFAADKFSQVIFKKLIENLATQDAYLNEFKVMSTNQMNKIYVQATQHPSFAAVNQYRELALSKMSEGGFGIQSSVWFETISEKINQLKKVEDQIAVLLQEEVEHVNQSAENHMYLISSLCLVFILSTVVIGIWSYRSINNPIQLMTDRMKDIAQGEGDLTQRVDASRRDELGIMAGYFNQFVEKIQRTVEHVAHATTEVASAATEIAATSEQMANSLDQQRSQSNQVAAAVEELSASVTEIATRATTLSTHTQSSGKTAEEGHQVVGDTVEQIQQISRIVNEASEQMHELGERSQAIGMVISVINDIADQTNLLALNAAIEAARAGQHGRGFAVVADEVRKLAERTTTATGEVADLISAIQSQTKTAIDHMGQGTALVDDGVRTATSAGDALNRIVGNTNEVGALVSSIAAATEEQSSATQEIAMSVESISHASDQSNEAATQAASAALQLSERAESLQTLVNQFKV